METDYRDADTQIAFRDDGGGSTEVRLEADGTRVSWALIIPRTIHVGEATVRMDGIGGVETEEGYRNRGYSRSVMEAAVRRMKAGDAALSMLWGIPNYYEKYGYATAGPEYLLTLPVEDTSRNAKLPAGWSIRPFASHDLPAVQRIYELETARAVGAQVRFRGDGGERGAASPAWSTLLEGEERGACRVVEGPDGVIAGYAWAPKGYWWVEYRQRLEPESLLFAEVLADGPDAADAILSSCLAWAVEEGHKHVEIACPPEGTVGTAAMLHGATFGLYYSRSGAYMCRCLDAQRLLTQLLPELDIRLRESGLSYEGGIRFETEEGATSLMTSHYELSLVAESDTSSLPVVQIPQHELARLALGAFPPGELLSRLPNPPSDEAKKLLVALFPQRYPHAYPVDSF